MKLSIAILIAFYLSTGAVWASDRLPAPGRIVTDLSPTATAAIDPTDSPDFLVSSEDPSAEFDFQHRRPYTGALECGWFLHPSGQDRHRGGGHPPTPATPPCVRVRTRRFENLGRHSSTKDGRPSDLK
jgi:hypothetical protein